MPREPTDEERKAFQEMDAKIRKELREAEVKAETERITAERAVQEKLRVEREAAEKVRLAAEAIAKAEEKARVEKMVREAAIARRLKKRGERTNIALVMSPIVEARAREIEKRRAMRDAFAKEAAARQTRRMADYRKRQASREEVRLKQIAIEKALQEVAKTKAAKKTP